MGRERGDACRRHPGLWLSQLSLRPEMNENGDYGQIDTREAMEWPAGTSPLQAPGPGFVLRRLAPWLARCLAAYIGEARSLRHHPSIPQIPPRMSRIMCPHASPSSTHSWMPPSTLRPFTPSLPTRVETSLR